MRWRGIPNYLLPAPSDVARALVDERGQLASAALVTLREMLAGFAAAVAFGLAAAVGLHLSDAARRAVYPLLVASQSVPVVAIAPVLVIYLGFGLAPKVLIVALVCFFPITVDALDGFRSVDPEYRRMMRTLHAGRVGDLPPRRVPVGAARRIFSGMRIAASYAAVAALFAEFAGGQRGWPSRCATSSTRRSWERRWCSWPRWRLPSSARSCCWSGSSRRGRGTPAAKLSSEPFAGELPAGLRGRVHAPTREPDLGHASEGMQAMRTATLSSSLVGSPCSRRPAAARRPPPRPAPPRRRRRRT